MPQCRCSLREQKQNTANSLEPMGLQALNFLEKHRVSLCKSYGIKESKCFQFVVPFRAVFKLSAVKQNLRSSDQAMR